MDNAALNIHVPMCVGTSVSGSLGYVPRDEIAGSDVNSTGNFWVDSQTVSK